MRILRTDTCTRVYECINEGERERERRQTRSPKGMEKPIPSYQRKWLLADRKERCVRSAEDDNNNNKRLRSVSLKLKPGPGQAFTIDPYNARCFNIRHPSVPPSPCLVLTRVSQPLHQGYRSPGFSLIVQNPSSNNLLTRRARTRASSGIFNEDLLERERDKSPSPSPSSLEID